MKKFVLMAALVAVVVATLALPALAHPRFNKHQWNNPWANSWWANNNPWPNSWWGNGGNNPWANSWWGDGNTINDVPLVSQSNEQAVQSGDSTQTITVTGGGANSNQCAGIQGISNTGNAVNNTNVLQFESFGDVGVGHNGNFEISPSQSTTCDQKVNQAASASGW